MEDRLSAALLAAKLLQGEVSEMARDSYGHPRRGLFLPVSAAADDARAIVGQLEEALRLLKTWEGRQDSV